MAGTANVFSVAVEGITDEAVAARLLATVGAELAATYGKSGKVKLLQNLGGYNQAARFAPWLVMIDLDHSAQCAPSYRHYLLPQPTEFMNLRVAVREIEAWLLADLERIAGFLRIPISVVPNSPENLADPKLALVNLARRSRSREILKDMVPRAGSGRSVGPGYAARIIDFASDTRSGWRPDIAAQRANSLRRCLARLREAIAPTTT